MFTALLATQCFEDDVSITMNFIRHVLNELMEVYPTSKVHSGNHLRSTLHFN